MWLYITQKDEQKMFAAFKKLNNCLSDMTDMNVLQQT